MGNDMGTYYRGNNYATDYASYQFPLRNTLNPGHCSISSC